MKSILTPHFEKNRITPGELEESGKILEKDPWVRAHCREKHLEKFGWGRKRKLEIGKQREENKKLETQDVSRKGK